MLQTLKLLWEITKPRLTQLVVLTGICGAAVAPGAFTPVQWVGFVFGSWGIVAAANAVNSYSERDVDALMERTKDRPLVLGSLHAGMSLAFSLGLAAVSVFILYVHTNPLTALLGFLGFALYVAVYTPLKRVSMVALFMGAIPGAIPPMMGWVAVTGRIELGAWILFAIVFFWQLPHFIAISLRRLSDYNNAGLKTVPGVLGLSAATRHMFVYTFLLILTSLLPYLLGMAGVAYLFTTVLIGLLFSVFIVASYFKLLTLNWNRLIFIGSLIYLPLVLGVWVVDHL